MEFSKLLRMQLDLQRGSFRDPRELNDEERAEFIRWNMLALEDELHEALAEVGWKPWATDRSMNVGLFRNEMVDAIHFFMNLLLVSCDDDEEPEDLADDFEQRYRRKVEVNAQRQRDGYDSKSGKCSHCHRDLAEASRTAVDGRPFCGGCGWMIHD
jgi:hypothetical protein